MKILNLCFLTVNCFVALTYCAETTQEVLPQDAKLKDLCMSHTDDKSDALRVQELIDQGANFRRVSRENTVDNLPDDQLMELISVINSLPPDLDSYIEVLQTCPPESLEDTLVENRIEQIASLASVDIEAPFQLACCHGKPEVAKVISKKAEKEGVSLIRPNENLPLLLYAFLHQNKDLVEVLVDNGATITGLPFANFFPILQDQKEGETWVSFAQYLRNPEAWQEQKDLLCSQTKGTPFDSMAKSLPQRHNPDAITEIIRFILPIIVKEKQAARSRLRG